MKREARRIDSANLKLMERIVGSAGTLDSQGMDKTFRRAQEFKLRHSRKTSVQLASRLMEQSSRLKNSVMTTYMLPNIDSASVTKHSESLGFTPRKPQRNTFNNTVMTVPPQHPRKQFDFDSAEKKTQQKSVIVEKQMQTQKDNFHITEEPCETTSSAANPLADPSPAKQQKTGDSGAEKLEEHPLMCGSKAE